MSSYLNTTLSRGVSLDMNNSWAARNLQEALSQAQKDARFQQKQMQEKEEKLLRLYENQQQRAFEKVSRGSSGNSGGTSPVGVANSGPGRVRQMFDERRQKAGIDRSYPLEPLKQTTRLNGHVTATRVSSLDRSNTTAKSPGAIRQSMTVKTSVQRSVSHSQTGKPLKSRTIRQTSNATYTNGSLTEQNATYEQENDDENDDHMMNQQQTELEMMMNNHNIEDTLDAEELPNVDVDELDKANENKYSGQMVNAENLREYSPNIKLQTTSRAPPTISSDRRDKPATRRSLTKPTTIVKSSPTRSAPRTIEKKSVMKAVSGAAKSTGSMPGKSTLTSKPPVTRTARAVQSATANDNLAGCKFCQRRFAPDRLDKHEEICGRTLKKKRKAYDAVKHRVQGTEAEGYTKKGTKATSVKAKTQSTQKSDWRRQHEEFINAIRAAKTAQAHVAAGGKLSDLPPPPPSLNPDYVQCPHCGRRFNETAAARHIPKCATMLHNKPNRAGSKRK